VKISSGLYETILPMVKQQVESQVRPLIIPHLPDPPRGGSKEYRVPYFSD